jgi:hypothetical protein
VNIVSEMRYGNQGHFLNSVRTDEQYSESERVDPQTKSIVGSAQEKFEARARNAWRGDGNESDESFVKASAHALVLTNALGDHFAPLAKAAHTASMHALAHKSASAHGAAALAHEKCADALDVSNAPEYQQAVGAHQATAAMHRGFSEAA